MKNKTSVQLSLNARFKMDVVATVYISNDLAVDMRALFEIYENL